MINAYKQKNGFFIIEILIIVCVILIYLTMSIPNYKRNGHSTRSWKKCSSNRRIILGTIEMYNQDHTQKILEFNDEVIKLLIKENYLNGKESDYLCPDKEGKYHSLGNIFKSGFIYCQYHNTIDGINIKPGMTFMDYIEEREKKEKEEISNSLKKYEQEAKCKLLCYFGLLVALWGIIDKIIKYNNKKLKK